MKAESNGARVARVVGRVAKLLPAASTIGGVGAVVALAPNANATVVHSAATDVVIPLTTAGVYVNVETGVSNTNPALAPGWDLNPYSASNLNWFNPSTPAGGVYMLYPGSPLTTPGNEALATLVDGTATWGFGASNFTTPDPGIWLLNAINYIGFRFIGADTLTHYGWASVLVGTSPTDPVRQLVDIYYEDAADTGILVGDVGAGVPEPATAALLATGVAGLIALRRRRKQTS